MAEAEAGGGAAVVDLSLGGGNGIIESGNARRSYSGSDGIAKVGRTKMPHLLCEPSEITISSGYEYV